MMTAILGLVAMVALIALFTIFFYCYCRWIRDRRIDLYTASPHSLVDPGSITGKRPEYDDDQVHYEE